VWVSAAAKAGWGNSTSPDPARPGGQRGMLERDYTRSRVRVGRRNGSGPTQPARWMEIVPVPVRLADSIFSHAAKAIEIEDIEMRVTELERSIGESNRQFSEP
jgi:hypothetical protein